MTRGRRWAAVIVAVTMAGCSTPTSVTAPSVTFGSGDPIPNMPAAPAFSPTGSAAAPVAGNAVDIDNFAFAPATLTVRAGSTVTWTNKDEEPHTVVADDGSFRSPGMGSQATFSFTFSRAGTFQYVCSIHPFMRATVVVTP